MGFKKVISLSLTAAMLAAAVSISGSSAADVKDMAYKDVSDSNWFYDDVKYTWEHDLMNGMSNIEFSPNTTLTRAMFITMLGRLDGVEPVETDDFPDVVKDTWYSGYVGWAAQNEIVKGFEDGTFRPEDAMTREQMAASVARYLEYKDCNLTTRGGIFDFTDEDEVQEYAEGAIDVLKVTNIVRGDPEGTFRPQSEITRAESAAIIRRVRDAIVNAWQGYTPEAPGDKATVVGANYLYYMGAAYAGGMDHKLVDTGDEYPILGMSMDRHSEWKTLVLPGNAAGLSISELNIDLSKTPYVKVCYGYTGMDDHIPEAVYTVNRNKKGEIRNGFQETLNFVASADDAGMKTAVADLSEIAAAHPIDPLKQNQTLAFMPCELDYSITGTFNIRYIAFFATKEEADAFTASSDESIEDYLKNYQLYSDLDWREFTDEDDAYYDKLLSDRIAEIKNSPSAVTPEDIEAAGGTAYYVSNVNPNASDDNDGLSPETPWKTMERLKEAHEDFFNGIEFGDGVFFERGSEWYAEDYSAGLTCLTVYGEITYGAYGEGTKPVFSSAVNPSYTNNPASWEATEWPNIYKIKAETNDEWASEPGRCDTGNIFFDGGRAMGIRVVTDDKDYPVAFGAGKVSYDRGYNGNGLEYYETGVADMTNPGTALKHDLEYVHDRSTNTIYLYSKTDENGKSNPAERFEDIKISRSGTAIVNEDAYDYRLDNLAILYGSAYGATLNGMGLTVTNCEIGFVGGALSSVESGIESFGESDGVYIADCYFHDIGDGPVTSQNSANPKAVIQNVTYENNVMAACGNGAEIWSVGEVKNITMRGNIMAYIGYGLTQYQGGEYSNSKGDVICSSIDENGLLEDNIIMHVFGYANSPTSVTYNPESYGYILRNNTYIMNTKSASMAKTYGAFDNWEKDFWKETRVMFPYDYATVSWYTSFGIGTKSAFYYYEGLNEHEEKLSYFMTGYYAEHGGYDPTSATGK